MNDHLIFCPKCNDYRNFIIFNKYVRDYELSKNDKIKIKVVSCEVCDYPIGTLPGELS